MYKTENEEELEAPYPISFLKVKCNEGSVIHSMVHPKYTPAIAFRQKRKIPSREA